MKRLLVIGCLALAACDGGGTNAGDTSIVAIRVAPANPVVQDGASIAFSATAFQVNGEQRVVTQEVEWLTSASSVVSIDADGQATAENVGEAYVTARLDDLSSPPQKVTVSPGPTPTPTASPANHLVISEVMYNAAAEPAGQYVEVFNPTGSAVNMNGWSVAYNNTAGTAYVFSGFTLNAGAYVVLANDPTLFNGTTYPTVTNLFQYVMPNLSNTGDWFILRDNTNAKVDEVVYGTGYLGKPSGWCSTNAPSATTNGTSVSRKPVNSDTNTCADWQNNTSANPGMATP